MPKFYAQVDGNGYPIPGTMMRTKSSKIPSKSIEIQATDVVSTKTHPEGLRYFVRKDELGNIIPNSLMIAKKKPSGLVYEFKIA